MMLREERNYEFRKRLLTIHRDRIRDDNRIPLEDEFVIADGCLVQLPEEAGDVILTAAKDFVDYLFTSMEVSVMLKRSNSEHGNIVVHTPEDSEELLGDANDYMGYRIIIDKDIHIYSHDERGTAQAFYCLEDLMSTAKVPYLKKKIISRKASFSPRMVHSGYGMDSFPNEHLSAIAHAGMDAILLFVKGVNKVTSGYDAAEQKMVFYPGGTISPLNYGDTYTVNPEEYPFFSPSCERGFSIKMTVIDTVSTVYIKWIDETKWTKIQECQLDTKTPLGYVQLWLLSPSNIAIDNFSVVNKDENPQLIDVEPKYSYMQTAEDYQYVKEENVYKDFSGDDESFNWYLLIPITAGVCVVILGIEVGILALKKRRKGGKDNAE